MKYFKLTKFKKGFTFVELLVVITIIGVLASIGVVTYSSANKKSRDGKRMADVEQIRAALEMYRADNDAYPATLGALQTGGYMQTLPQTPQEGDCAAGSFSYEDCYSNTGDTAYTLEIDLEDGTSYSTMQP
jgi:general secretion pathway protein G